MFCRMSFTLASKSLNTPLNSLSFSLMSGSCTALRRKSSLPTNSPFKVSRKEVASLPSRNATSASITSDDNKLLAFFAMRWVNITWSDAMDTSRCGIPACTIKDTTCCANSNICTLAPLIDATLLFNFSKLCCWLMMDAVSLDILDHCLFSAANIGCAEDGESNVSRCKLTSKRCLLSFNWINASLLPNTAS